MPEDREVSIIRLGPEHLDVLRMSALRKEPTQQKETNYGVTSSRLVERVLQLGLGELYLADDGEKTIGHTLVLTQRPNELEIQEHLAFVNELSQLIGRSPQLYYYHRDAIEPPGMAEFFEIVIRPEERGKGYSQKFLELIKKDWEQRHGQTDMMAWIRANNVIGMREFNRTTRMSLIRFQGEPLKEDIRQLARRKIKHPFRSNETNLRADTRISPIDVLPAGCQPGDVWKSKDKVPSKRRYFILPMSQGEQSEIDKGGVSYPAIEMLKKVVATGKDPTPGKHFVVTGVFTAKELETAYIPAQKGMFYLYLTRDWKWKKP